MLSLKVLRVGQHTLPLPAYAKPGDAGMDLRANLEESVTVFSDEWTSTGRKEIVTLDPGQRAVVDCGFAFEIPEGYEGQVRGRSGLAMKERVFCAHFGTIDAGYRSSVRVMLWNGGNEPFYLEHGDRLAQLVVAPCARCEIIEATELSATDRGANGFGSTGAK